MKSKLAFFMVGLVIGSLIEPVATRLVEMKYPKVEDEARKEQRRHGQVRGGHEDEYISIPVDSFRRRR